MHPDECCTLNREVQQAMSRIEDGIWSCSYLSLSWHTTVLCLSASVLPPLAEVVQEQRHQKQRVTRAVQVQEFFLDPSSSFPSQCPAWTTISTKGR